MKWLSIFSVLICLSFSTHKFYVSRTLVNHNAQNQTLEITMDIFTDDLELALEKRAGELMRLGDEREHTRADEFVEAYLQENFEIRIDDRKLEPLFIGKQVEFDLTYCYLEYGNVQDFHTLQIKNSLLCDTYDEQSNIVDLSVSGWNEKLLFTKDSPLQTVAK